MKKTNWISRCKVAFVIIAVLTVLLTIGGIFSGKESNYMNKEVDDALVTNAYHTDVTINEDNSYEVKEKIDVHFTEERHGIYRNIPYEGYALLKDEREKYVERPVHANITMLWSNTEYDTESEDGYEAYRFGEEEKLITDGKYEFAYRYVPMTDIQNNVATFNVFPTAWRSNIPKGSSFTVTFPKEFDHSLLKLYYGEYGKTDDGADILKLSWKGNTLTGTLKEELLAYQAVTFMAEMPEGYFTETSTIKENQKIISYIMAVIALIISLSFLIFGVDRKIKKVSRSTPPDGIDSILAGYLVDGEVDDEDIISGIYYMASLGYLSIRAKGKKLYFTKKKEMPSDEREYLKKLFWGIFRGAKVGEEVSLSSLKYKLNLTMSAVRIQLTQYVNGVEFGGVYTMASRVMRGVAIALTIFSMLLFTIFVGIFNMMTGFLVFTTIVTVILYVGGLILLCYAADKWYALAKKERRSIVIMGGLAILLSLLCFGLVYGADIYKHQLMDVRIALIVCLFTTVLNTTFCILLKKRTRKCNECLGEILGFRDYIEQKQILQQKEYIESMPELYYDIIPYAMSFGLLDGWLTCLEELKIPNPVWYTDAAVSYTGATFMDYAVFRRTFYYQTDEMKTTLHSVRTDSSGSSNGSGGGFTGGDFSGGGFSGGGFGGGGGGSW